MNPTRLDTVRGYSRFGVAAAGYAADDGHEE